MVVFQRERAAEAAGELQQQRQEAERQRVERLETQVNDARLHLDRLHHTQGRMSGESSITTLGLLMMMVTCLDFCHLSCRSPEGHGAEHAVRQI